MKILYSERLKLITPCFCAGADAGQAELRAPAIRGQLRWWFRVLGGTAEQEKELFGGIGGGKTSEEEDNAARASKIIVRIKNPQIVHGEPASLPHQNGPMYYLFHFVRVSGKKERYNKEAWFAPGTTFELEVIQRLPVPPELLPLLNKTWNMFLAFGTFGLRHTRGLGAFVTSSPITVNSVMELCRTLAKDNICSWALTKNKTNIAIENSWSYSLRYLEAALGSIRKHGFSGNDASPLGSCKPRQASALLLRPVQTDKGIISLLLFVPQVLGRNNVPQIQTLRNLLNSNIDCKYPYTARPPKPDTREDFWLYKLG